MCSRRLMEPMRNGSGKDIPVQIGAISVSNPTEALASYSLKAGERMFSCVSAPLTAPAFHGSSRAKGLATNS
jgi:hypothetical protein